MVVFLAVIIVRVRIIINKVISFPIPFFHLSFLSNFLSIFFSSVSFNTLLSAGSSLLHVHKAKQRKHFTFS